MKLSVWHNAFKVWVQDIINTTQWGVEIPSQLSDIRAHLPPITGIRYNPTGVKFVSFSAEQQLFYYQRFSRDLLYDQLDLNTIEGFYGSVSYAIANEWKEIHEEIDLVVMSDQEQPIIVREMGDNRGDWFVQLTWTFEFTAELEPETSRDTYEGQEFSVDSRLWTVKQLTTSDLLPRFPDYPATLPGVIEVSPALAIVYSLIASVQLERFATISNTVELITAISTNVLRESTLMVGVSWEIGAEITILTSSDALLTLGTVTSANRVAPASLASLIEFTVNAIGGQQSGLNSLISLELSCQPKILSENESLVTWSVETINQLITSNSSLVELTATSLSTVETSHAALVEFTTTATTNVSGSFNTTSSPVVEVLGGTNAFAIRSSEGNIQIDFIHTGNAFALRTASTDALIEILGEQLSTVGTSNEALVEVSTTTTPTVIPDGGGSFTYLFDSYPNTTGWGAAFFKLSSTYTGNCCKVRNSVSLTEYTIGWSGDLIDETALLAAYEGNNSALLYLIEWYDQSGNGTVGVAVEDLTDPAQGFPPIIGDINQTLVKFNGEQYIKFTDSPPCAFKTMWTGGTNKLTSLSFYGRAQIFNVPGDYSFYIFHRNLNDSFGRLFFGTDGSGFWYTRQNRSGIRTYTTTNDELFHNYCWRSSLGDMDIFIDDVSIGGMFVSSNLADDEDDYTLNGSFGAAAHASNQGASGGSYFNGQGIRYTKYHVIYDTVDDATTVAAKNVILNQ